MNDVLTGANSVDDTRIDFDSGMSVTLDKVNSTVDITGASISAAAMTNELTGKAYTVVNGAESYAVATNNTVKTTADAKNVYVDASGKLTNDDKATVTETYHEFANGNIYDDKGAAVYAAADGSLTTETTSKSEATANPLAALDDAISQIDKFRSSLGAIQNRLDSAVTNLNNTTTNLSEAQSRIQDADYATEVSNMSKAQIIQQAGNSVLAKANQVPQQVLSLLQG